MEMKKRNLFMIPGVSWFSEDREMLILSVIGFLVIREALNQAYEGGNGDGNT